MPLQAICPECGATVPLIRQRWLQVHNEGSAQYIFPGPDRPRCPGSLILTRQRRRAAQPQASTPKAVSP